MDLKQIGGAVASFAPTIAAMLGGPLAGTAVSALEGVFGLNPGAGTTGVADALQRAQMTPEQLVALTTADDELKAKLGEQANQLAKINADFAASLASNDVADRSSARLRETNVRDLTPKVLAFVITAGFFAAFYLVGFVPMQQGSRDVVMTLLGSLGTAWIAVVTYYFGSSSGASRGQELLAQSAPTGGPIGVVSK